MRFKYFLVAMLVLVGLAAGGYWLFQSKHQDQSCYEGDPSQLKVLMSKTGGEYVACELIVKFADGISQNQAESIVRSEGLEIKSMFGFDSTKYMTVRTPWGKEDYFKNRLMQLPQVELVITNDVGHVMQDQK